MYIVQGPDGNPSEPVSKAQVQEWIKSGHLPRQAPIRNVNEEGFSPAEMHADFSALFKSIPTVGKGSKLIPSGNGSALTGYYVSIASCFPIIGLVLGIIAIILGIKGLQKYNENPAVYGKGHSITALVFGSIGLIINLMICGFFLNLHFNASW